MNTRSPSIHPMALRDKVSDQAAEWLRQQIGAKSHLSSDSRKIAPGDAFLARKGKNATATDHLGQAIASGASAIVLEDDGIHEPVVDREAKIPTLRVPELGQRMGMVASAFYQRPSMQLQLIAVTGTNGKSTVTAALGFALARCGIATAVIGTLGLAIFPAHCDQNFQPSWDAQSTSGLTTADAVMLQRILSELHQQSIQAVVMEASSIGLYQGRLQGCAIKAAAFTNLSHDHLEFHGSMDEYAKAKALLFESPALGAIIVNTDDDRSEMMWRACDQPVKRIAIGAKAPANADAVIEVLSMNADSTGMKLRIRGTGKAQDFAPEIHLPAHGRHNVENAMVVAGCMLAMKIDASEICARLKEFRLPAGRLQMVSAADAPWACVDYAHSPQALLSALDALKPVADSRGGKLICVFGCGGNRDTAKRPLMGEVASRLADQVIVTSDNPRHESPSAIMDAIFAGIPRGLLSKVKRIENRQEAIAAAIRDCDSRDLVLIAGKGHETTQVIGNDAHPFDDSDQARKAIDEWLRMHQKAGAHA